MKQIGIPADGPSRGRSSRLVHWGVVLSVLALGAAVYFTPIKDWLAQGELIKTQLDVFGMAAPLVFVVLIAMLSAIGVPRLLLCSLGGMTYGFAWGLLWTQLGTLLGSYATFLFVRWRGRDYALSHYPRLRRFSRHMESRGVVSVILLRQLPMNGFYNNVFLGLSPVGQGDFLLGSLLGYLPLGVTACLIGAGLIQADLAKGVQYAALALSSSVILGVLLNGLLRRRASLGGELEPASLLAEKKHS